MAEETKNLNEEIIEFGSDKQQELESNTEFELIDDGTYEVVLERIDNKQSNRNGKITKYLNLTFAIRNDVNQSFKNRKVWYTIFARENDKAFNFNEINALIITQEGRKDYKRHFKDFDEILQYLIGLHMTLDVAIEFNQFKGKDDNVIVNGSFKPSVWDTKTPEEKTQEQLDPITIPDDDLPF